jgi:hypothetical protein
MITTDSDGNLVYIPSSGSVTKTAFNSFSNDHIFFMKIPMAMVIETFCM